MDTSRLPSKATAVAIALAAAIGLPSGSAATRGWCEARLDAAWTKALRRGTVAVSLHTSVIPLALGRDGRTFFASVYSSKFSGVARVDAKKSGWTPIRRFPDASNDQAGGRFDGRWLVWKEYHSLSGLDDFTVWAWDARSGKARQIGAARRAPSGDFWTSPWRDPEVRNDYATWTQGSGPNGVGEVHVFDLLRGRDRVVRTGRPQGSFLLAGGLVVWPESMRPGAKTVMRAAAVASGRSVAVPRALRNLRGISWLAPDGRSFAYPSAAFSSLWWSPSLNGQPQRVFTSRVGFPIQVPIEKAGRYIAFTVAPTMYLADTTAHSYLKIGKGGFGYLDGTALLLTSHPAKKAIHPLLTERFLPLASLPPMPRCS